MSKPKPVNWGLIEDSDLYKMVQDLIEQYHGGEKGIVGVNFVLMWRYNIKIDPDGYVLLASITKSSDQVRELRPHDVIIGINKDAWGVLNDTHKKVVIDSQLERIAVCFDKSDKIKEDDLGRVIYRLRKSQVVDEGTLKRRHGLSLLEVQDYIHSQFVKEAEEGSYVAGVMESE
jgi:hypothetical protein